MYVNESARLKNVRDVGARADVVETVAGVRQRREARRARSERIGCRVPRPLRRLSRGAAKLVVVRVEPELTRRIAVFEVIRRVFEVVETRADVDDEPVVGLPKIGQRVRGEVRRHVIDLRALPVLGHHPARAGLRGRGVPGRRNNPA